MCPRGVVQLRPVTSSYTRIDTGYERQKTGYERRQQAARAASAQSAACWVLATRF